MTMLRKMDGSETAKRTLLGHRSARSTIKSEVQLDEIMVRWKESENLHFSGAGAAQEEEASFPFWLQ